MNELSDGEKKNEPDKTEDGMAKEGPKEVDSVGSNLNENASRPIKMVESSGQKSSSATDLKEKSKPPDKGVSDKRYDSRERPQYRGVNGIKPSSSGRGRREDDRRPSPNKQFRKESSGKGSGSYRGGRESESKKSSDSNKPFSDESRLSKLVRRLQRESERERRLTAAKNLHEYLYTSEGTKWALRNGEDLLAVLREILFERGYKEVKTEVAYCIGLVGSLMGPEAQRYFQWIFGQINGLIGDDVRALFLIALQETLKYDEKQQATSEFIPMVLSNLQTLLENADTAELLMSVVSVILQLTRGYPQVFSDYFRDTVDILVGWHIDSSQKDSVIDFTSQALISFQQFWVMDQAFTQELLGQFLEDMEAYAEDLHVVTANHTVKWTVLPDEVVKIGSLLNVFSTVIKGLGDQFDPNKSRQLSTAYFLEVFDKILLSIDSAVKSYFSECVVQTANACMLLMLNLVRTDAVACQQSMMSYIVTLMFPSVRVSYKYTTSCLQLTKKVIDLFGSQFPVTELVHVLGTGSLLQSSKLSHSPAVLKELSSVYHVLMALKSIPLLEECYRFILGDIQQSFNTLLEASCDEDRLSLISSNPFESQSYNKRDAEAVCIFNLAALGEIGNMKNNLIGMWALSPSLFDLYTRLLEMTRSSLSIQYPAVQYAILHALYSHASRHGNFISTSSLLTQNTPLEGSVLANVNPTTSGHFSSLLKLLASLLTHTNTSYDTKLLALRWVHEMIGNLHTSQHVYITRQFLTLVQGLYHVGYDPEEQVAMATQLCLAALFRCPKTYPGYIVKGCVKLCLFRVAEGIGGLCDAYISLLNLLPINVTASKNNGLYMLEEDTQLVYNEDTVGLHAMWQACRHHSTRVPLGSFHSHSFRHVMGYILHNMSSKHLGSLPWLEAMYQSAQRPSSKTDWKSSDSLILQNFMSGNTTVQWFWATWEAAQFCVLARLRTPLGKPQETFTSIEGVLKSFAAEVNSLVGEEEEDGRKRSHSVSETPGTSQTHLRVKLLLQFMENLEKQLYNAYEGAAVSMATLPKTVRTFFRTNKNTCQEWLSRVRVFVITVALHAGMYTVVVRHAWEVLVEMKGADNVHGAEFETMVLYLVQALCELGDADAVQGVYAWCKDVIGRKVTWIKAAVEKAYGRYETAAKEYKTAVTTLLQSDPEKEKEEVTKETGTHGRVTGIMTKHTADASPGQPLVPFPKINMFVNEVMDCYVQLNDWDAALSWQETYSSMRAESAHNVQQPAYNVDMCLIRALASFDGGEIEEVSQHLDLIPGLSDLGGWGIGDKEHWVQSQLIQAAAIVHQHTINNHKSELVKILKNAHDVCDSLIKIQSMDWPVLLSHDTVSLLATVNTLKSHVGDKRGKTWLLPVSEKLPLNESDHSIYTFLQAVRLIKLQQTFSNDKKLELSEQLFQLQLGSASLARKQHNYGLAEKLLRRQTGVLLQQQSDNGLPTPPDSLKGAVKLLQGGTTLPQVNKLDIIRIERECAKLTHSIGEQREAVELLTGSVVNYCLSDKSRSAMCSELCARSLLSVVKWLQADHKMLTSVASRVGQGDGQSGVCENLHQLLELEEKGQNQGLILVGSSSDLKIGDNPILMDTDRIVGRLLHLSTIQCESLPKAWYSLAGWCYKWGRKAVDNASHGSVQLFEDERFQIETLIPQGTSEEERESILTILSQIHSVMTSEEDISDQDQSQYDDGTETTRRQLLMACPTLQTTGEENVEALLEVWRGIVHRIYHYYQLSATAYFKFLKLNGGFDPLKEKNNEDCNVISTLRLLRLLVKHAWELRNVLEDGLAATPTVPWKGIIPQLFSRLSHPEAYVRQSIGDLLCRVAEDAPHLIVYPAVVGSSTRKLDTKSETGLLNNYLTETPDVDPANDNAEEATSQEEEDLHSELEADSMLHSCIMSMLNTLATNFPQMISDVKQLIEELRRITLLWDELWLGTLNQQHPDVERRITQLENEIKKVNNNTALSKEEKMAIIREKHKTVLKPTVYTMERLQEITSQVGETPHEKWFQDTYGPLIKNALEKLKNPPNPSLPRASWHPFKQIHVSLQQKAQKRSSLMLSMEEISPSLFSLRNTVIAMPGLGTAGQLVTIQAVSNSVQILPTKTKPKKLVFKGSDGKRYAYLFKGLEDLHLDERIMQFLNIVNNMFDCANKGSHELYRARHYSVTPLGPRSGLIQWVDGVTPLFALYKRWQQREALVQAMKQQAAGGASGSTTPNIPRPSEIYYNKLTPALREKGIKDLDSRKDWPLGVQRKVLEELMSETPRDLLAKELWCASTGPNEWWYVTQTYARSTAVMSMIGYIIGLGDRHLDNVLVDLATGEVVHIDYNVCFEKGKGLRVPEKVPFRLTQNIEMALGVTGIEGKFRLASEHVMKTMRKGRETLLTLLEAFVYDPLVDWTTGNEGGYTGAFYGGGRTTGVSALESRQSKLDMEKEITTSMFSIRVAEMKAAWQQNRDELVAVLPRAQTLLDVRNVKVTEYSESTEENDKLQRLKQEVVEAQANPTSNIFTLHDRFKEYQVIKTTQDAVNKLVEEKINECAHWQQVHKHVMQKIQGSAFQKMCADIAKALNLGTPSFAAAKDFLQGAGQGSVIAQCEQVESELTTSLQLQRGNLHRVMEVLHTYGTIVSQFGSSFAENTRTCNYLLWLQELVSDFSENRCLEVVSRFSELYGEMTYPQTKLQLVLSQEMKLETIIQEAKARLIKLLERRSMEKSDIAILDSQVQESRLAIDSFVKENGEAGISSLTAVVVTVLCALNKRNLQMEAAAAGAGDRLMDLTSRDGDWFLEELCSMSGNVSQFLDMIKACQQVDVVLYKGMVATHHVYMALQDLNVNYRTIILPEALKIIQSQEPSVFTVLSQLETILSEAGQSLDSLIARLEILHRNAVMGIKNENNELLGHIQVIQQQFHQLLDGGGAGHDLSPGQMLLMGFNGLFTRLDDEFACLMDCLDLMQVPEIWKKVDVIREAKAMQLSSFTVNTRGILYSLFFVRRLQVMQEFFHMCTQFAAAIQGLEGGNCYDDEQLSRPVKHFIADYVRKQVIGFPSQILGYILCMTIHTMGLDVTAEIELKDVGAESKVPLEDLCKKAMDLCLRNGQFQQVHFTQASTLTTGQDATWRRHDLTRRLDSNIELLKGGLQRAQLHLTRLHWLHEDLFIQAGRQPHHMVVANRASVMSEIKKCMQALVSQETGLVGCQSQYTQLESSITQRLKWAAGANPSLNLILQQFDEASKIRKQLAEEESKHSQEVISLCQGILHLEALRTRTPEAMASDTNFLGLINKCTESCILTSSASSSVTDVEVQLMEIKALEEGQQTDQAWLKAALKEVNNKLKETDKQLISLKDSIDDAKDGIKTEAANIKALISSHHKIMSDIRAIMKSLAKQEEQEYGEAINSGGIRDYMNIYKKFSENLTLAVKLMVSEDFTPESLSETKLLLEMLQHQIPQAFDELIGLAPPLISFSEDLERASPPTFATALKKSGSSGAEEPIRRPSLFHRDPISGTPPMGSPQTGANPKPSVSTPVKKLEKVPRDPKTGKAIQERNSYAVGVWRRVKMKLDGRDPDPNKRLSVAEQVDYVIKDATNLDNLAVLYEGWTPWV